MKYYFAPMEGVTGYAFRAVHHAHFHGIDQYYTPFVVATPSHSFKGRERSDVAPENNAGVPLVPQILGNKAEDFLWAAGYMADLGYHEVNLNLGCPVGTVSAKGKGSGFLRDPEALDRFLDAVFTDMPDGVALSVKTRIGYESPAEMEHLMEIYNRYPIAELTVHARTRQEFYNGQPHLEVMDVVTASAQMPLVYNGNVCTVADADRIASRYPSLAGIMIGRGLLADPALVQCLTGGPAADRKALRDYHNALYAAYEAQYAAFSPQRQGGQVVGTSAEAVLIGRMKELWAHLGQSYANSDKYLKQIRKARTRVEYTAAVRMLMNNCEVTTPPNGLR